MITQLLESKTTTSSPLNLTANDEEPLLSFSQLLKGINSKDDSKTIQNGVLVLSLEDTSEVQENQDIKLTPKNETLLSLLKNETTEQIELVELNPALTSSMSPKELKTLVLNAKEYLKEKILQSPEYKKAEVIEFPKTLKGLAQLAEKFSIAVHKISVEEVQEKATIKLEVKTTSKIELQVHKESLKTELKVEVKNEMPKLKEALKIEPKIVFKNELSTEKEILKQKSKEVLNSDFKVAQKSEVIKENKTPNIELKIQQTKVALNADSLEEPKISKEMKHTSKQKVEVTPLFKAQTSSSELLIQSAVSTHNFKTDTKNSNVKTQESSKPLLHTKKSSQVNSSLTADFVVDTAKVIAPDITSKLSKGLESLLFSQNGETSTSSNVESLTLHKTDSFEVKLNEAKQMIKYLSSDVKTAIEDYKSPFTRVKLQLNPQRLGEVDLTIVQRGKNLHINLSSNSAAINTLSMNVNELRVQLNNSGINNATLNFNNSSQSDGSNTSQQQNRQNERQAQDEYTYFEHEETDEEILSSLEIVVPDYA